MKNSMYASENGYKLGIFEGDSNHALMFSYLPSLDMVEVRIMRGEIIEAQFTISAHDNQHMRKYEGLIGIEHYFARIRKMIEREDAKNMS